MPHDLKAGVIRVLNTAGETVGAGFLVAERLAVTCAHVVGECDKTVEIQFYDQDNDKQIAKVLSRGWSDVNADDVAFLELENQPPMARPVTLGPIGHCSGHDYIALGFPDFGDYQARWPQGKLGGMVPSGNQRQPLLQLEGREIDKGCSGGPVLDITDDRVVGMITEYRDSDLTRFAYATIAETLQSLWPELRLLPPGYDRVRLASYLQDVQNRYQYIDLKGIPLPRYRSGQPIGLRPPLDQVYIRLQAVEEKHQRQQETDKSRFLEQQLNNRATASLNEFKNEILNTLRLLGEYLYHHGSVFQAEKRPEPVDPQTALEQHRRLVILGAPGSGKSTLLRFLALQAARDPQGPLPIMVLLREYAAALAGDRTLTLREFALQEVTGGDDTLYRTLKIEIAAGRILWLVDALDEARGWSIKVAEQLNQLPGRLVITSRPLGYISPPGALPEFEVLPFTPEDTDDFLQRWFTFLAEVRETGPDWVEQRKDWLKKQLQDRPQLQPLARNPLLLTFLAILAGEEPQRDLPVGRTELYRRYVEELLGSWEKERYPREGVLGESAVAIGPLRGQTALKYAEVCLDYLGWSLHLTYFGGQFQSTPNRRNLIKKLVDCLQHNSPEGLPADPEEIAKSAIDFWREADLLDEWQLYGEKCLAFRHLTFEEYTTARILEKAWQKDPERNWKFLRPRLHHYAWREPILLFAGLLNADDLADLVGRILRARSPYERILRRDLRLAVTVVGEWPDVNPKLTRDTFNRAGRYCRGLFHNSSTRSMMLTTLEQIGKPAIPALIQALGSFDPSNRREAKNALVKIQEPQVVSDLIKALKDSSCSPDIAETLCEIGKLKILPQAVPLLCQALAHYIDPGVRWAVAFTLGQINDPQAEEALLDALDDPDKMVELIATVALKDKYPDKVNPVLLQALHDAAVLSQMDDLRSIPVLLEKCKSNDQSERNNAIVALGQVNDPQVVPALCQLLSDNNADVRRVAADVLGRLGDPQAIPYLAMIIISARRTWITLRKLRSIQATPAVA